MGELSNLKGIGPKSEKCLNDIGIFTKSELETIGPARAFIKLRKECAVKPSMNFLYAMVGALENQHWANIARKEKGRLIMELEGYRELEIMLNLEGEELEI